MNFLTKNILHMYIRKNMQSPYAASDIFLKQGEINTAKIKWQETKN